MNSIRELNQEELFLSYNYFNSYNYWNDNLLPDNPVHRKLYYVLSVFDEVSDNGFQYLIESKYSEEDFLNACEFFLIGSKNKIQKLIDENANILIDGEAVDKFDELTEHLMANVKKWIYKNVSLFKNIEPELLKFYNTEVKRIYKTR